ncbi:hypothetical protein [Burkholderia savannae]|uniref:hypothetical protein n=1 Tax=Burkholderia savannae TaxID=1637837 RepID=UPI0012E3C102|nr:hypothetical protein [Burkholderia savannae]
MAQGILHRALPGSAFSIQHSAFSIQHSAFSIQHSAFSIQHSAFSIQHSNAGSEKFQTAQDIAKSRATMRTRPFFR